jgi:tetratricopeptide (TPR) repeat protein
MIRLLAILLFVAVASWGGPAGEEKYIVVQAALRTHMPEIAFAELGKTQPQERDKAYWLHLGHTLRQLGRPMEATDAFAKGIELEPQNAPAYDGMGMAYTEAGDPERGERFLVKATELAPMEASFHHDLAKSYLMRHHYEKARAPLSIALRLGGGKEVARHLALAMTLSGDEAQAKALLMKYYDLHELYCLLGEAYELGEKIPEAVVRYQMALMARSGYHRAKERLKRLIGDAP